MSIGTRIREEREALNIKRPDLAKRTGIPYPTLAGIENGDQTTSTKIHAIAEALGVKPRWLETGEGPKHAVGESSGRYGASRPQFLVLAHAVQVLKTHLEIRGEPAAWVAEPSLLEMAFDVVSQHEGDIGPEQIISLATALTARRNGQATSAEAPPEQVAASNL